MHLQHILVALADVRVFISTFVKAYVDANRPINESIQSSGNLNDGLGTYKEQKGHHPMAKSAFDGDPKYNADDALTISQAKLNEYEVEHPTITGQQHSLYSAFSKTGKTLTMSEMRTIEIQAMTNSGVPVDYATNAVDKAIQQLQQMGITAPSKIPWGK